jgi:hypothetical protein
MLNRLQNVQNGPQLPLANCKFLIGILDNSWWRHLPAYSIRETVELTSIYSFTQVSAHKEVMDVSLTDGQIYKSSNACRADLGVAGQ